MATDSIKEERVRRAPEKIITEIAQAGPFHPAEEYVYSPNHCVMIIRCQIDISKNNSFFEFFSYHQKFRLQAHKDFAKTLGLNSDLLLTSFVATKLNGYLVGVGGIQQFDKEAPEFGLNQSQLEYARRYVRKNEGAGLSC